MHEQQLDGPGRTVNRVGEENPRPARWEACGAKKTTRARLFWG